MHMLKLAVTVGGHKYLVSRVNPAKKNKELFYHFCQDIPKKGTRIEKKGSRIKKITAYEQGIPDHISFHRDGTVHITSKGAKEKEKIVKLGANICDLHNEGTTTPLLMDSVFPLPKGYRLPEMPLNDTEDVLQWDLTKPAPFSVIVFLMSKSVDPKMFTDHFCLNQKLRLYQQKYVVAAYDAHNLLIVLSGMVFVDDTPRGPEGLPQGVCPVRAFCFDPKVT